MNILELLDSTETRIHEMDVRRADGQPARVHAIKLYKHHSAYLYAKAHALGLPWHVSPNGQAAVLVTDSRVTDTIVEIIKFRNPVGNIVAGGHTDAQRLAAYRASNGIPADILKSFDVSIEAKEWTAVHRATDISLTGQGATHKKCVGDLILSVNAWRLRYGPGRISMKSIEARDAACLAEILTRSVP